MSPDAPDTTVPPVTANKHDPKLLLVATLTSARTYHFRSPKPLGGWALCTVNDSTGELLITSDWGNWVHIWNPKHLGSPSLTHFIADRQSYDYLASKLLGQSAWVLDADATIAHWRKALVAARLREGRKYTRNYYPEPLSAYLAREIWHSLGSLFESARDEQLFHEHASQIDGFHLVSECPWEDVKHCYSSAYRVLVDFLLPALAAACAATVCCLDQEGEAP